MDDSRDARNARDSRNADAGASRRQLFVATALALGAAGLAAQPAAAKPPGEKAPGEKANEAGKPYAIIFRQGPRQITDADIKKRFDETRAWAQHQNAAGHKLDPHILAPEGESLAPDGTSRPAPVDDVGAVTAILFLVARDLAQAVEVARAHPALRYGASVEVRPWAPPPPPAPPPATPAAARP